MTDLRRSLGALSFAFLASSLGAPSAYAQQGGDSVAARIDRLEQQFRDLQVSVGTIESLVRGKPGAVLQQEAPQPVPSTDASAPAFGDLNARVGALETQIGALAKQLEQLGKQIADLQTKLAATASPAPYQPPPRPDAPQPLTPPAVEQSEAPSAPPSDQSYAATEEDPSKPRWFGGPPDQSPAGSAEGSAPSKAGDATPPAPDKAGPGGTAGVSGDAQSLYEQGYGAMLQHDYGAAESAFRRLIAAYPNDPLAGNAQYWIGESYYVRGRYKSAADAFLKGYKKYKSSDKAPDTLLKLGMSLAELGQKEAACSTFGELAKKFPQAPAQVLDQAKGEREKAGCKGKE